MRQRILSYDLTFGTQKTDAITLPATVFATRPPVRRSRADVRRHQELVVRTADTHACTGSHQGRYQPGWTGVDVPEDRHWTITVNGAGPVAT